MSQPLAVLAIDMGSSSLRAHLGVWEDQALRIDEVYRAEHEVAVAPDGTLTWDVARLCDQAVAAADAATRTLGRAPDGVAVDGWGVDYALVDAEGRPLGPAWAYRDGRGAQGRALVAQRLDEQAQFAESGVAPQDINTGYRLAVAADQGLIPAGATVMFIQDVVARALATRPIAGWADPVDPGAWASRGVASTSGLADRDTACWQPDIVAACGIDPAILPPLADERTVAARRGDTAIIRAGSHDTACAAYSLGLGEGDLFVSCGSWAIVGAIADAVIAPGLTNEATVEGGNRVQANLTGMWLAQECRRAWQAEGEDVAFARLDALARAAEPAGCTIDPSDPAFAAPGHMPQRIRDAVRETHGIEVDGIGPILRLISQSLAVAIADNVRLLRQATAAAGRVFVMGGGTKDRLLMRLLAGELEDDLVLGAVEASALGNICAQLHVLGVPPADTAAWARTAGITQTFHHDPNKDR
ncbi:MAG: FGGY-family carbohydrate kinase [Actinomycetaceae bacterium]|nr:FGGY-family carbohydrate kinase [Actinomycetaceae bacterium]MDU0970772.1 FGGY-family carbohydrate kinase [Actinomycetaceae bacterium]